MKKCEVCGKEILFADLIEDCIEYSDCICEECRMKIEGEIYDETLSRGEER